MSRLYPILQRVWIGCFLAIVISLVGSYLFEVVIKGQSLSFDPSLNFLRTFGIGFFVGVLGLGTLTLLASRDRRRREREQQFSLFKSATDLTPEDFGFKRLGPGEPADPNLCPHYPAYFCRKVADTSGPSRVHEDEELARSALDNKGFLLIGPPLDGKTRTLYQVVSQLKGHIALAPFKDRPVPSDAAFSLIKGKDVILLLDDLSDYVESVVSLGGLAEKLNEYASHWVVAATCRDGPELSVVREAVQGGVSRFYEGIPMKLRLVPQDADEKHMLTASIGADWESENSDSYPTPGSITMAKPLEAMRLRFEKLQEDKKDVLRSLVLLLLAGIPSLTHRRVQAVIEEVFQRNVLLGDCLQAFADSAFLRRPALQDPILPEPAYLLGIRSYSEGKNPRDDFPKLIDVLASLEDLDGILYLSVSFGSHLGDYANALVSIDEALAINPDKAETWLYRGVALGQLERSEEALGAFDEALAINPDMAVAWFSRGANLINLKRWEEALGAFDKALDIIPDEAPILLGRGRALLNLEHSEEALETLDKALDIDPDDAVAWYGRGVTLGRLGRWEEALEAFDKAVTINPDNAETWYNRGEALRELGRDQESNEAFNKAKELESPDS